LQAGGGAENLFLVVNADSYASRTVANEYIKLRRIPASNVIYLDGVPNFAVIDVQTFRERILKPILDAIKKRGLERQIDYIVYSSDFPYGIDVRGDIGKRKLPKIFTPTASINGLTFLYQLTLARNPDYLRLDINRYARRPVQPSPSRPLSEAERKKLYGAMIFATGKDYDSAARILSELVNEHPDSPILHYNLACCLARLNRADEAIEALRNAVKSGWLNFRHMERDEDLKSLHDKPEFRRLIERMKKHILDVQPTHGFRNSCRWNEKGVIVESGGQRYMLSTVLAVTSGRGNSLREALNCLRRSAAADGTRPKGTIYYASNENIRSVIRDWAFPSAVAKLKSLGVNAEIVVGKMPLNKPDVQGVMMGTATFDWAKSGSTILRGAICEHLTSAGGVLREGAKQTPLTEFIRYGAAGASGTVREPFAIPAKFPSAFLHVHYARGCSLAEAFYQSVTGPYQLLIVGDALCAPWAKAPRVKVDGVKAGDVVKGLLRLRPKAEGTSVRRFYLFVDGVLTGECRPSASLTLDTTGLADGFHELRVVAVADDPIEARGRIILPVRVNNRNRVLEIIPPAERRINWDEKIRLSARLVGARRIAFLHNSREVAEIRGEEGSVEIPALPLGSGVVRIRAVGFLGGGRRVVSEPIEFEIVPPPALPALQLPDGAKPQEGFTLRVEGKPPAVVMDTAKADWLKKAGVRASVPFELTGYFEVAERDVYQFQIRTNLEIRLTVDSRDFEPPKKGVWKFVPVHLAAGWHRLRIRGRGAGNPLLDVRFGGRGTRRINGTLFRHLP